MKKKTKPSLTRWNEEVPEAVLAAGINPLEIWRIDETAAAWRVHMNRTHTIVVQKAAGRPS